MMRHGYPVLIDLTAKSCVVIGRGEFAEARAAALREAGAEVTLLERWTPGSLRGMWLAVVTDRDPAQAAEAFAEAERERVLINSMDDAPHCHFHYPAVHRQGALVAAIWTSGACPALAVKLRDKLAAEWGPEYAAFLERARELRPKLIAEVPDFETRKQVWQALVEEVA